MSVAATDDAPARRRLKAARLRGLYAVTPDMADAGDLRARVGAALDGGAAVVQYRNKLAPVDAKRTQAALLASACAAAGALFIVNDDPALAAVLAADGVHLGEDDGGIAAARAVVGPECLIGVSCYNDFARAEAAVAAGADYVAFGSFFDSEVKPQARRAGLPLLERGRGLGVPVVAIGGITAANAQLLVAAGADAVAVISAVFGGADVAAVEQAARDIAAAASAIA